MYHLFTWDLHEAVGGLNDYEGSFDEVSSAKKKASEIKANYYEIVMQEDGDYIKPASLVVVLTGSGEYENDNPPVIPAPKDWDWGEFIIEWQEVLT